MKVLVNIIICLFTINGLFSMELEAIRNNFIMAPTNKILCKEMISKLDDSKSPLHLAYLGAFKSVWAIHVFNPIGKLSTFNQGKEDIEEAISLDPDNIEIRLIRFSVQSKAPKILGYKNNISEDKMMIIANLDQLNSIYLKKIVNELIN
jgi:hypothetical protein